MGFDADATSATGNTLNIALGDFKADGDDGPNSVLDTLAFTVTAPEGWYITGVRYEEGGTVYVETGGIAVATGSITAGGVASNFGSHIFTSPGDTGWSIWGTVDLTTPAESIQVSIVNSLFAAGEAWIQKTGPASVEVMLAPVPIPSTLLLLGSGVFGLALWRRRRS
ncbi:MAG: PEP-CTERM sorting domain-containing protein [Deltaproteobacteria bacterium]|nr:PEP-CTERM sorting domain-containing protein [Deltaproteobacteria bacterium]